MRAFRSVGRESFSRSFLPLRSSVGSQFSPHGAPPAVLRGNGRHLHTAASSAMPTNSRWRISFEAEPGRRSAARLLTKDEVEDCEGMCYEHYNGLASDIEEYSDAPVFHAPFIDDEEVLRMIGGMR